MTTTDEKTDSKKLTLNRPKKLELKKTVETGQVRQSFSHGRSKTVQVEVRRKRVYRPGEAPETPTTPAERPDVMGDDGLTRVERESRLRAIEQARGDVAGR